MQEDCSISHWEGPMRAPVNEGNGFVSHLFVFLEDDPSNHTVEGVQSVGQIKNCASGDAAEFASDDQFAVGKFFDELRRSEFSLHNGKKLASSSRYGFEVNDLEPVSWVTQTSCACELYYPELVGATQ